MTKQNKIAIVVVSIATLITSAFIIWLVRKNKYKITEGELINEDVIGIMETWDKKSNEVISQLHPKIRQRATDFVNDLKNQGITYRLYSGNRSFDEQAKLYGKGRTAQELISLNVDEKYAKPSEAIVTKAKPGSSFHNYGLAFDGVEIKDNKAIWSSPNESQIVNTAKQYGFYWGGNFTSLKDTPHFEDQQFGNVSQLLSLYNANKLDASGFLIV